MALMMLLKKRPKKSVVPPSGNIQKTINIPAKKHGAPSAHTINNILSPEIIQVINLRLHFIIKWILTRLKIEAARRNF
jgi:hypothetical protein